MSRAVAVRLGLLVAILLGGFSYIIFSVLQVRVGAQPFPVTVDLRDGGGLFVGSYVDYRGVEVGRVTAMDSELAEVRVVMDLNPGTKVPSHTQAIIHDLSAVGEQYVDLVPTSARGPYLRSGSVIPITETQLPVSVETLLNDTGRFTNSISTPDLSELLQTLTTALNGSGPQLHTILVAGESLAADLKTIKPQTKEVIDKGHTVLGTAQVTNPQLEDLTGNLASLTAQLRASDHDIRALIANGNSAFPNLSQLLQVNTKVLAQLTANAATVAHVTASNSAAVQALLASVAPALNQASSVVRGGVIQAIFGFNDEDPVCTYTTNTNQFPEPTATHSTLTLGRTCTTKAPNLLQRGADEAPEASK